MTSNRLFVAGLNRIIDDFELGKLFDKFEPTKAFVKRNYETGESRGFGFVQFDSAEVAAEALSAFNGFRYMDNTLRVSFADPNDAFARTRVRRLRDPPGRPFVPRRVMMSEPRNDNDAESDVLQHEPPDPLARSVSRSPSPPPPPPQAAQGQFYIMFAVDPTNLKSACETMLKKLTGPEGV